MKEKFRYQNITSSRMEQIERANEILDDYESQGYSLTLRQLYYQLVASAVIPNEVKEYTKLSQTVVMGRMNGLIDWNSIEDRLRKPYLRYWVSSIEEAVQDTIDTYRLNRQEGQPFYMEIWTEKDAVSNILKRVSKPYHIRLMVNRGYSSCSAMYESYNRIMNTSEMPAKILYVGDYDPSGLDMLRDIEDRLEEFGVTDFQVIPVALTKEQIDEYSPPPNPAKITDPRAKWYIAKHGTESWELDALKPQILEEIVKKAVLEFLDKEQYEKMLQKENGDIEKLREILET